MKDRYFAFRGQSKDFLEEYFGISAINPIDIGLVHNYPMSNTTLRFRCQFCVVTEALGSEKLTQEDKTVVKEHLASEHGWICEEEFQTWR